MTANKNSCSSPSFFGSCCCSVFNSVYFVKPIITKYKCASEGFTVCTHRHPCPRTSRGTFVSQLNVFIPLSRLEAYSDELLHSFRSLWFFLDLLQTSLELILPEMRCALLKLLCCPWCFWRVRGIQILPRRNANTSSTDLVSQKRWFFGVF